MGNEIDKILLTLSPAERELVQEWIKGFENSVTQEQLDDIKQLILDSLERMGKLIVSQQEKLRRLEAIVTLSLKRIDILENR